MGLFDGYFDPQQFGEGGGLLGRLLALQQSQGLYQPGANFDQAPSAPPVALPQPTSWSILPNHGPTSSSSQAATPNPALQYQALLPILGDRNAMLATIHPDIGRMLIAQALANQQNGTPGNVVSVGDAQPVDSDASPDPVRPGSQYAQGPMALCAAGLPGCVAGVGLTVGQAMLGGAALGGLGAIILNNQRKTPAPGDKPASAPIGNPGNETSVVPGTDQPADGGALVTEMTRRKQPGPHPDDPPGVKRYWEERRARHAARNAPLANPSDKEPDFCSDRRAEELKRCFARYDEYAHEHFLQGCKERARIRWDMCYQNGGQPDPTEPKEWDLDPDEELYLNLDR